MVTDNLGAISEAETGQTLVESIILPYDGFVPRDAQSLISKVVTRARYAHEWLASLFRRRGVQLVGESRAGEMFVALFEMGIDLDVSDVRLVMLPILREFNRQLARLASQDSSGRIPTDVLVHMPGAILTISNGNLIESSGYVFKQSRLATIAETLGLTNPLDRNGPSPFWCMHLDVKDQSLRARGRTQDVTSFSYSYLDDLGARISRDLTDSLSQATAGDFPGVFIEKESFPGHARDNTSLIIIPLDLLTVLSMIEVSDLQTVLYSFTLSGGGSIRNAPLTLYPMQSGLQLTGIPLNQGKQSETNQTIYSLVGSRTLNEHAPVFVQISYTLFWLFQFIARAYSDGGDWDVGRKVLIPKPQAGLETYAYVPSRQELKLAIKSSRLSPYSYGFVAMVEDLIRMMAYLPGRPVLPMARILAIASPLEIIDHYAGEFGGADGLARYRSLRANFLLLGGRYTDGTAPAEGSGDSPEDDTDDQQGPPSLEEEGFYLSDLD